MVIENEDARLFSSSRQGWKELFKCVRSQQLNAKVLHPLISEYRMIESGRVYYAHRRPLFCLPNRGKIRKKIEPIGSIIRYSIEENHLSAMMIMPSFKETKSHVTSKNSAISPTIFSQFSHRIILLSSPLPNGSQVSTKIISVNQSAN